MKQSSGVGKDSGIELIRGDITDQNVNAIVNAANESLLGGGGVDGAIHRVAGPELLGATRKIGGCLTGEARITPGFRLPADYVIHTVGPVWHGGGQNEDNLLANCYLSSMQLAHKYGIHSIAFPSISTGVYRFPMNRAVGIALRELRRAAERYPEIDTIRIVAHGADTYEAYEQAL